MDKVAMFPTAQSVSNRPHKSLEEKVERLTRELKKLRYEVAELSNNDGSTNGAVEIRSASKALDEPDFDWEKWARETKARIRGESVDGAVTANSGDGAV